MPRGQALGGYRKNTSNAEFAIVPATVLAER
jgi:hypothetical protein